MIGGTMKTLFFFLLLGVITAAEATTIKATALPQESSAVVGQTIHIPVSVDLSTLPQAMGSFTASLTWDTHLLQYVGHSEGTSEGFTNPVVNDQKTAQGKLVFASANPKGAKGRVNILNVEFKLIGAVGSRIDVQLAFSAMAAASTFENLLPYLESTATATQIEQRLIISAVPTEFKLLQNFPNPFNPSTNIGYALPTAEHVTITIYNTLGQKVKTLVDEQRNAGNYAEMWDGRDDAGKEVPAGAYLYKLQAGNFSHEKKMLLVK
jgi:hypothetical protein